MSAYRWVYDKYAKLLYNAARRVLGNAEDAEDAVQMSFIRLYRGIKNFRYRSSFCTYLYRILMNVCFDVLNREKKERLKRDRIKNEGAAVQVSAVSLPLEEAIGELPERMRTCFVLHVIEQIDQKDIARIMDLSLGGVKSHIFQAKVRLRTRLTGGLKEKS